MKIRRAWPHKPYEHIHELAKTGALHEFSGDPPRHDADDDPCGDAVSDICVSTKVTLTMIAPKWQTASRGTSVAVSPEQLFPFIVSRFSGD